MNISLLKSMKDSDKTSNRLERTSFILIALCATSLLGITVLPSYAEFQVDIMKNADTQGCEKTESCYSDAGLIIKVGETVTWKNSGKKPHSIISGSSELGDFGWFNSGIIIPGKSFSHTFIESGQFFYYCQTHPWMKGIVMVR
jgi:plastocyanin